jgi:hypothetical protein
MVAALQGSPKTKTAAAKLQCRRIYQLFDINLYTEARQHLLLIASTSSGGGCAMAAARHKFFSGGKLDNDTKQATAIYRT